jgi:ankyrin repeat protein
MGNHADVNANDKDGYTPLHIAAQQGRDDVVKLLLAGGADVNAKDDKGETPLQLAKSSDKTATVELLRQHGGQ